MLETTTPITSIDPAYAFHKLNGLGQMKANALAESFTAFTNNVQYTVFGGNTVPVKGWQGTEWNIVKQKLEEACFYAKKAMAIQIENQVQN